MSSKNSSLAVFCVTGLVVGIGLVVAPWFIEALPQPSKLVLAVSGAVLTGLFGILVVITRLYIKGSADEAFVRTGVGGRECVIDGGALVIPVVHNIMRVSLRTFKLVVQRTGTDALITHDCLRAEVKAVFYVRVQKEKEAIEQAATSLGQISDDLAKMEDLIQDKLISALRTVAATKTLNDLNSKLAEFAEAVQKIVQADLRTNGLTLESVTINNQPRPEAVVLGRPPEGAVYVRLPPLGAWSWSGPGFSQAPAEASPLMTNSRLIQCHARVLPSPDQNGKSTPDRSKLLGSHGQRPWF